MRYPDSSLEAIRAIARQVLPGTELERVQDGVSTPVYRLQQGGVTLYLRLAEEQGASLAPEALVHHWLRERGVRVPEVVHFEPFNARLQRAVMVTSEIPGRSLAEHHRGIDLRGVLTAAGRDLAIINGIPVTGFGFVRRDRPPGSCLEGEASTWREFALAELEARLAALSAVFDDVEIAAIRRTVHQHASLLDTPQAVLAHGDFDATHIYHRDGEYSGIIDFGEIRGADPLYDLGHFALHDGESMSDTLLPLLLDGYRQVTPLTPRDERAIQVGSLLIGIRALARGITRPRGAYQDRLAKAVRRAMTTLV